MPTKMRMLKEEVIVACKWRGHKMGNFFKHNWYKDTIAISHCKICDMQVIVNTKPQPNEIDIGGEAVALTCREKIINEYWYEKDISNITDCDYGKRSITSASIFSHFENGEFVIDETENQSRGGKND